ncbi:hypothetical protein M422DRAFT_22737 [Sphaerobolus stellatus SS14]|nr:hypothetical protein M422DRAFT_22737 [Sphaerobolus stellatus SS14]
MAYPAMNNDLSNFPHLLLQTALRNHAFEAKKRRGRFKENENGSKLLAKSPNGLEISSPSTAETFSSDLFASPELEDEEDIPGGSLFSSPAATDLRRNRHVRRGRRPPRLFEKHSSDPSPVFRFPDDSIEQGLTRSAPIRITPGVTPVGTVPCFSVTPLQIVPKLSINPRNLHSRSHSAPENITPIEGPGEDSLFPLSDNRVEALSESPITLNDYDDDGMSSDSMEGNTSEPPSAMVEWSTNMFLIRGDSSDNWPTEFPVEALEEDEWPGFSEGGRTGATNSKRQTAPLSLKGRGPKLLSPSIPRARSRKVNTHQ